MPSSTYILYGNALPLGMKKILDLQRRTNFMITTTATVLLVYGALFGYGYIQALNEKDRTIRKLKDEIEELKQKE